MIIENCKVTFDGSFYVAKAPQPSPYGNGKKKPRKFLKAISIPDEPTDTQATTTCENPQEDISEKVKYAENARAEKDSKEEKKAQKTKKIVVDLKEIFNELYLAHAGKKKKKEIREEMLNGMRPYFENYQELSAFVDMQLERVYHNKGTRSCRLWKKMHNVPFNYFITVTYDSKKHTEETFRRGLTNFLKHAVNRKKWRYMGVWERGNATERLHFHALVYIPDGQMIGELIKKRDYSTKQKCMQTTIQNTHLNEKFGRTDFEEIFVAEQRTDCFKYIKKYMEKSGEKMIVSRNCPTHYNMAVFDSDILLTPEKKPYHNIMSPKFVGITKDGEIIDNITPEKLLALFDEKVI